VTTVELASNRFENCSVLIAVQQNPLLRIETEPLRVSLTTPPGGLPSGRCVAVVDNEMKAESAGNVHVVASQTSVTVFWDTVPMVIATLLNPSTVSVRIDLRPLGINVFDDTRSLHVAASMLSGNQFSGSPTAIGLG
jgi:hypothetical protein